MKVHIPIVAKDESLIPFYAHHGDAGADLRSAENLLLNPGQQALVDCGISVAIPKGLVGLIHPRSGLAIKSGVTVINAPGTIDSGYRGPIKVGLINHGPSQYEVKKGDRIAQLLVQEVHQAVFIEQDSLENDTTRGEGGFGSTGDQ